MELTRISVRGAAVVAAALLTLTGCGSSNDTAGSGTTDGPASSNADTNATADTGSEDTGTSNGLPKDEAGGMINGLADQLTTQPGYTDWGYADGRVTLVREGSFEDMDAARSCNVAVLTFNGTDVELSVAYDDQTVDCADVMG